MNWRLKSDYKIKRGDNWALYQLMNYSFIKTATFAGRMYGRLKYLLNKK